MRDTLKNILVCAVLFLVLAGVREYRQFKNRVNSANATALATATTNNAEGSNSSAQATQALKPSEQSAGQNNPAQQQGNARQISVTFDISKQGDASATLAMETGFTTVLTQERVKLSNSSGAKPATEIAFFKDSETSTPGNELGLHLVISLEKAGPEKWGLKYRLQKGYGSGADVIKSNEVPFPNINPLPGHKAFYTDKQIGEYMARFVEEEVRQELFRTEPHAGVRIVNQ